MQIVRTMEEIEQFQEDLDYINALDYPNAGDVTDHLPATGYISGLSSALDWLTGRTDEYPLLPKE